MCLELDGSEEGELEQGRGAEQQWMRKCSYDDRLRRKGSIRLAFMNDRSRGVMRSLSPTEVSEYSGTRD